jgi:hypothetical protein
MRPALVYEDEPLWLNHRGYHHSPSRSLKLLVALRGYSPPFFLVGPMRAMARHMVERLTESPVMASMCSRSAPEGSQRALFEVLLQKLHGFIVQLRRRSGSLLRG